MECCVYCGDYCECRDHVIPISYDSTYRYFRPGDTVKCCNQCNGYASDKVFLSLQEKARFLYYRYHYKNRKALLFPDWTEDELRGMGYVLRRDIEISLKKKSLLLSKIQNLDNVSQGYKAKPIDPLRVRGKSLGTILENLDELDSYTDQPEGKDEQLKKKLRGAIANNFKQKIFFRELTHTDGRICRVFNLSEFMRRHGLKAKFWETGNEWSLKIVRFRTKTKDQILAEAVYMINTGDAIC